MPAICIRERHLKEDNIKVWMDCLSLEATMPLHAGFDLKTRMAAVGVVDANGRAVAASWMPIDYYGDPYGAAEQAMRWTHHLFWGNPYEWESFSVEEIPFHSKNSSSRDKVNRVAYAVGAQLAMLFPYEYIHNTMNWTWKNKVLKDAGCTKAEIETWCLNTWPHLDGLSKMSPPDDVFDGLMAAEASRMKYG
jgi:hypothetical protein